ncbi:dienelactone hydrolase family protein [Parasphingopyxis algicola]|uniref:dienelactone hydrolase family protein n=1 Tax=Parasphingopyxis algicola TaxID=2026624 RepID=UPI0015A0379C|nr:dienelactone hydrolase family protein [Parasphingopyxis algicola]QLC25071.1 dienelactone hydrolase family protein [Parasphingopyxis algicola]
MCHGAACAYFPPIAASTPIKGAVMAHGYGDDAASRRVAVLPDIYGCNPFYRGFATYLAKMDMRTFLVDPFDGLGELPEISREAAFERRHKLRDAEFIDNFLAFSNAENVNAVIGFCLGGFYVFELARRDFPGTLVGLYGFPQGMDNQDPLPAPFDYLPDISKRHVMLMGGLDSSVGPENVARLKTIAENNHAIDLTVFDESGHGFLADLDGVDPAARTVARQALGLCEAELKPQESNYRRA